MLDSQSPQYFDQVQQWSSVVAMHYSVTMHQGEARDVSTLVSRSELKSGVVMQCWAWGGVYTKIILSQVLIIKEMENYKAAPS